MKTLILVRHGKSSWDYNVSDKDRPLKERGINDAHLIGASFSQRAGEIDAAFSSPANRALHTAMIVLRQISFPDKDFRVAYPLYDFSGGSVMDFAKNLDGRLQKVIFFGHNHAFTHIANRWGSVEIDNVPTSGLVELQFEVDQWSQLDKGKTVFTLFPKQLR